MSYNVANRRPIYTEVIPIRWGDMDAAGHVNNTIYFRYMEQARISWLGSIGLLRTPEGHGMTVINANCTFLKELVYPGNVEVTLYAGEVGRSSFQIYSEMRPSYDRETIYADGSVKLVWVDYAKSKSMPLPELLRSAVAP
jgi:acyl-CoA thioester hydrolase